MLWVKFAQLIVALGSVSYNLQGVMCEMSYKGEEGWGVALFTDTVELILFFTYFVQCFRKDKMGKKDKIYYCRTKLWNFKLFCRRDVNHRIFLYWQLSVGVDLTKLDSNCNYSVEASFVLPWLLAVRRLGSRKRKPASPPSGSLLREERGVTLHL